MTAQEILKVIEEAEDLDYSTFAYMDYDSEELGLGPVEEVDSYGGEDCGSEWYSVQYFKDHDVYIRIDGYYQSYDGTEFDNPPYEVKKREKTVIVFE